MRERERERGWEGGRDKRLKYFIDAKLDDGVDVDFPLDSRLSSFEAVTSVLRALCQIGDVCTSAV